MNPHAPTIATRPTFATTTAADLVTLAKPRITLMVLITTLGGMFMAPVRPAWSTVVCALVGTALIVAGANALNMFLERDVDRNMTRTRNRPLPAGRLSPRVALAFGLVTTAVSLPLLVFGTHPITALLAAAANASYVLLYTPLKQRTWLAVVVGAFPGAVPPLLGSTAASGRIELAGLALFGVLFFWQVPHFHAIALFRRDEYARAGLKVLPNLKGERATKIHILGWTLLLAASTFAPLALGVVAPWYALALSIPNSVLVGWALRGLRERAGASWAKGFFALSMPYLVLVFAALLAAHT